MRVSGVSLLFMFVCTPLSVCDQFMGCEKITNHGARRVNSRSTGKNVGVGVHESMLM